MRNYIVINGKDSRLINGLLIQSLPPISKPKMRTRKEEIDGRDGDIITDLGYSSYDKEVLIGLHGDFNIDDVIAYFNGKGIVTFSNESDLYYRYQIIDQIDYERLIRFRTAKVRFHVQPFKYSNIETGRLFTPETNLLVPPDGTHTNMGLTSTINDGVISVRGTATGTYSNCMPRTEKELPVGKYTVSINQLIPCQFRLYIRGETKIKTVWFKDGVTSMDFELVEPSTYYYYYLGTTKDEVYDFSVQPIVTSSDEGTKISTGEIVNSGNYYSKPTFKIKGQGAIGLYIDNIQVLSVIIDDAEKEVIIDTEQMNAYTEDNIFVNRSVSGDYNKIRFQPGINKIAWSGEVEKIIIENYSRWL